MAVNPEGAGTFPGTNFVALTRARRKVFDVALSLKYFTPSFCSVHISFVCCVLYYLIRPDDALDRHQRASAEGDAQWTGDGVFQRRMWEASPCCRKVAPSRNADRR